MADISKITLPSGSEYNIKDAVAREELANKGTYSKPANGIPFEDLADDAKMVILSYGNSTWAQFLEAYRENRVIYCRASSNSNPASGSQTRMAFLAYVNNQANPTEVEFQYYRSVSSHTNSQQGDQVFVYKLNSSGTWSVITRNAFTKIVAGTGLNSSYSNTTLTITNPNVYESKTAAENGTELSLVTTGEKYAWNHASGSGGDADTVNGHTVNSDVPANAVFTDTTYSSLTAEEDGEDVSLVTTGEKYIWDHIADSVDATTVNGHTVATDVPANAIFDATKIYYGTCTTSATVQKKVVDCSDFTSAQLKTGTIILIYFQQGNKVANPTLNINNTGAKSIYLTGEAARQLDGADDCQNWPSYSFKSFCYNGGWRPIDYQLENAIGYVEAHKANLQTKAYYGGSNLRNPSLMFIYIGAANTYRGDFTLRHVNEAVNYPVYINGEPSSSTNYTLPKGLYLIHKINGAWHFRTDDKLPFDIAGDAATVNSHTVASDVPANAVFTDTHRPIQVDGTQILGSNTTALNLVAGQNITLTNNSGAVTIDATGGSSGGGTNPNLLNNWWFGEGLFHPTGESPITATIGSGGFNIFGDAWHLRCGTVTKVTEGSDDSQITYWQIVLQQQVASQPGQFLQFLQNPLLPYPHGPYTLSVLCKTVNTSCEFGLFVDDHYYNGITIYPTDAFNNLYTYTFDMLPSFNSHTLAVGFDSASQAQINLFAMKLEVGSESTLAIQNQYGEWVIHESPINKLSSYGGIIEKRLRIQTTSTDSLGKNVLTLQNLNTTRSIAAPNGTSPLRIGFYDQYTDPYGFIGVSSPSNTESGLHINAYSPSGTANSLELTADSSGNRKVAVSDAAAWRKALGIGDSNGAFPLTVAQGGTGSTTQNFVDLTTAQTIAGAKTFSDILTVNNAISVKRSSGNAIVIDDQTADSSTNPSSAANYIPLAFRDKNGVMFGGIRARHTAAGYKGLYIYGNNSSAPSGKQTTALYMMVTNSGTKYVSFTDPDAWRDALGLGTNGALPITIGQGGTGLTASPSMLTNLGSTTAANILAASPRPGVTGTLPIANGGTGQTALTHVTTASSIITAGSGITIVTAEYSQWGKVAQLYIRWKNSSAVVVSADGNATNVTVGTIVSGKRPKMPSAGTSQGDGAGPAFYSLATDGTLQLGACGGTGESRTIAASSNFYCFITYLLP